MRTCAFCPHSAKLSAEHIWSEWMGKLFPIQKYRFTQRDLDGTPINTFSLKKLDITAKVVCKPCNEGWMSRLETEAGHAMKVLIVGGKTQFTFSKSRAKTVADFAFKTAVIIDHMGGESPFFRRSVRYRFAATRTIPTNVQMWFAGFLPRGSGHVDTDYRDAAIARPARLKLYVCTYMVGHFIFQVVSAKYRAIPPFRPKDSFEELAVPFFPSIPRNIRWPPQDVLRTPSDFDRFSRRWGVISFEPRNTLEA